MPAIAQSTLQGQCAPVCKINSRILPTCPPKQSRKYRQCTTFSHSFLHSHTHSTPFHSLIRRKSPPIVDCSAIPFDTNDDIASVDQDKEAALTKAILLSYYASRSKSLFASRCIVEALIDAYRSGYTISDINLSIALSGMTSNLSSLSQTQNDQLLLPPIEGDILRSWVALVMVTLQTIGLELSPEGYARRAAKQCEDSVIGNADPDTAGIQNCVDHALGKFTDEGVTLQKMLLQQSLGGMGQTIEGDAEAMVGTPSPAVAILQGQTRLILLTLEMIASAPEGRYMTALFESMPELAADKDSPWTAVGYMDAFYGTNNGSNTSNSTSTSSSLSTKEWQRSTSIKLLISFMGAVQGLLYPALEFVDTAIAAYKSGMTADDVVGQLSRSEINQTGGVVPIGVQKLPGPAISAALFSQWVSLTYITLAQLGTEHPLSRSEVGWAWASPVVLASVESIDEEDADQVAGRGGSFSASALEAYGVADFVAGALRQARNEEEEEEEGEGGMGEGRAVEGAKEEGNEKDGFLMRIEDPSLSMTSPTAMIIGQQVGLVRMVMQRVSSE